MSVGKKPFYLLGLLLLVYLTIELLSLGVYYLVHGQFFAFGGPYRGAAYLSDELFPDQTREAPRWAVALHPYLGAVSDGDAYELVNQYGFLGSLFLLQDDPQNLNIAILGGSLAADLFVNSSETLKEELSRDPRFRDKNIQITCLALGGYKQPQQLMALNYYLVLGGDIDLVINMDGFNEIVLPAYDLQPYGVAPYYPRNWLELTADIESPDFVEAVGNLTLLRKLKNTLIKVAGDSALRYSPTAVTGLSLVERRLNWEIYQATVDLRSHLTGSQDGKADQYFRKGPGPAADDIYQASAEVWTQASVLLQHLAHGRGSQYFHFLQPNQYTGSKILTETEKEIAYTETGYTPYIREGYPYLKRAAADLITSGVQLVDLTPIFDSYSETLYSDPCCHLNKTGHDILAAKIAETILDAQ